MTPQKYGNIFSFATVSFDFPALLYHQKLNNLIADSGPFFPNLVREFYAIMNISTDSLFISEVKGKDIAFSLEDFGKCLEIPFEGQKIFHNYTPE